MMRPPLASLVLGAVALSGCPDSTPSGNPRVLWLGPDRSETHVKLVDAQPPPY